MQFEPKSSILNTLLGDIKPPPVARQIGFKRPTGQTEAECVIELDELLVGVGFDTYWEVGVRHASGKLLKVGLLAIRDGHVIAFEVKKENRDKLAWAFRQARDYVLAKSMWGMVLACFIYPSFVSRHGDDYERGMAKLASYDRVGTAYWSDHYRSLVLEFGGHVVFRRGEWTSQAKRFLEGQRQLGGHRSNGWQKGRFIRRF